MRLPSGSLFLRNVGETVKKVSLVVPVFNEEDNLREFYKRATAVMQSENYDYSLVFVDDGSKDKSRAILNELSKEDAHVEAYLLSRNYGQYCYSPCGTAQCRFYGVYRLFTGRSGASDAAYSAGIHRLLV